MFIQVSAITTNQIKMRKKACGWKYQLFVGGPEDGWKKTTTFEREAERSIHSNAEYRKLHFQRPYTGLGLLNESVED